MNLFDRLSRQFKTSFQTAQHSYDYARHLIQGNQIQGNLSLMEDPSPPVVLVHGFLGTRGTMQPLARRFQRDGRVVFTYAYGTFNTASIRSSAQKLAEEVQQICLELDVPHVDMVGFSMGGLIAMHAIKFLQAHRWVRRLATMGSPFAGTWKSLVGAVSLGPLCPSVWQLIPTSRFLQELRSPPAPPNVEICQVHATHDFFCPAPGPIAGVSPQHYHMLPGGHSSIVVTAEFYEVVRDFLDRPWQKPIELIPRENYQDPWESFRKVLGPAEMITPTL